MVSIQPAWQEWQQQKQCVGHQLRHINVLLHCYHLGIIFCQGILGANRCNNLGFKLLHKISDRFRCQANFLHPAVLDCGASRCHLKIGMGPITKRLSWRNRLSQKLGRLYKMWGGFKPSFLLLHHRQLFSKWEALMNAWSYCLYPCRFKINVS